MRFPQPTKVGPKLQFDADVASSRSLNVGFTIAPGRDYLVLLSIYDSSALDPVSTMTLGGTSLTFVSSVSNLGSNYRIVALKECAGTDNNLVIQYAAGVSGPYLTAIVIEFPADTFDKSYFSGISGGITAGPGEFVAESTYYIDTWDTYLAVTMQASSTSTTDTGFVAPTGFNPILVEQNNSAHAAAYGAIKFTQGIYLPSFAMKSTATNWIGGFALLRIVPLPEPAVRMDSPTRKGRSSTYDFSSAGWFDSYLASQAGLFDKDMVNQASGGTSLKYWNGASFLNKPVKYWTGAAWVTKPVKRWSGSAWV